MAGRPALDHGAIALAMGSASNLRMKSAYGNVVIDRRNDAQIIAAVAGGGALHTAAAAERARIAYGSAMASDDATMRARGAALGSLAVRTGAPGRPALVRNL